MDNIKKIYNYLYSLFITKYKVTVSFNKNYGDSDDKIYLTKKILVQKEKHLKFRNMEGKVIEYRSANGLNYIIEDI
tara:strand:- start:1388 stop:1615 length:228 start_codon:yes stop_codon:yes gene_type:complete